jgi:peptidoglycan hydrolase-like protein with peptidoglycan-binding domain
MPVRSCSARIPFALGGLGDVCGDIFGMATTYPGMCPAGLTTIGNTSVGPTGGGIPTPNPNPTPACTSAVLKKGASGPCAKLLHELLAKLNLVTYVASWDKFGEGEYMAVRTFQAAHGLTVDGVVGPKTWPALVKAATGKTISVPGGGGYVAPTPGTPADPTPGTPAVPGTAAYAVDAGSTAPKYLMYGGVALILFGIVAAVAWQS